MIKPKEVFLKYPSFKIVSKCVPFLKWGIVKKSTLFSVILILAIILTTLLSHTFFLEGKDLGLIEHPTILVFIVLQIVSPYSIQKVLSVFFDFLNGNEIINAKIDLTSHALFFNRFISRDLNLGRLCYSILMSGGFLCFIWNSYQNQNPYHFLGFDFWDSINHWYGYWLSRMYKFYLWVLFFPSLIHIQIAIIITLKKILDDAEISSCLNLKPYHPDKFGGTAKIIKMAINPFIPVLILSSIGFLATLIVHGGMTVTPFIGLLILSFIFLSSYLIPAYALNKVIKSEKKRQLNELATAQDLIFHTLGKHNKTEELSPKLDTLNALNPVIDQIRSIPNWPYLNYVTKLVGAANTPVVIAIAKQSWPYLKFLFA